MGDFFSDLSAQVKAIWSRLDGGQRLVVGAVMAAAVVGLIALVWFANRPDYQVMFTARTTSELQEAQQALHSDGVGFQPTGNGMALAVDRSDLARARSALANAGLTSSGGDDESNLSSVVMDRDMKRFLLDRKRLRTAENHIGEFRGVVRVKIQAAIPKARVFRRDQDLVKPKGSIIVWLNGRTPFDRVAAAAAEHLASTVGMPVEFISVIDGDTQRVWSADPKSGRRALGGTFEELQRSRGQDMTNRVQALLDAVYRGKVIVEVAVELDTTYEYREEDILSDEPRVLEETTKKSSTTSAAAVPAGDPSTAAATSGARATGLAGGRGGGTKEETKERKYLGSQGRRQVGKYAPELKRLSCALVIDVSLQDRQTDIENLVKGAILFDTDRKDLFSTVVQELPTMAPIVMPSGPGMMDTVKEWAPTVAQLLGVVLVLLFLKGLLKKSTVRGDTAIADETIESLNDEQITTEEAAKRMRSEIEKAITKDPAAMSKMFEAWLAEVRT